MFCQALNYAHARFSQYHVILDSTKAIVFFGTPHQGSDAATWASFLGSVGKAVRVRNTDVVEELRRWSSPLVELTTTFSELAPKFLTSTYFETKATNGVVVSSNLFSSSHLLISSCLLPTHQSLFDVLGFSLPRRDTHSLELTSIAILVQIVPEGSARMGQPNERIRGLEADHHDVCKFTVTDPNWNVVKSRLEAIAEEIGQGFDIQLPSAPARVLRNEGESDLEDRMEGLRNI